MCERKQKIIISLMVFFCLCFIGMSSADEAIIHNDIMPYPDNSVMDHSVPMDNTTTTNEAEAPMPSVTNMEATNEAVAVPVPEKKDEVPVNAVVATPPPKKEEPPKEPEAIAKIFHTQDSAPIIVGEAHFTPTATGLHAHILIYNVPTPGLHAIHIHENGSCNDKGNAAGGHFNPKGVPHGNLLTDGPAHAHMGDFGNISININGHGDLTLELPGLHISGTEDNIVGKAIILHEKIDDFGQPTGNAGERIACGVIEMAK